jgi:hypothetical protein
MPAPSSSSPEDLISLFNQQLFLSSPPPPPPQQQQQQQQPTPPLSPANFSISQHYHHSAHRTPLSPPHSTIDDSEMLELEERDHDREYAEYLLASDLSSPNSLNELEIALAHGVITGQEYSAAARRYLDRQGRKALEERCSAAEMLGAAQRERSAWSNEYYGQLDMEEDEEVPCQVYGAGRGLRPFEL